MSGSIKIARNHDQGEMFLNQRVGAFKETDKLNNDYLYHYLSSRINDLKAMCSGGTVKNLGKTPLMNFKIPVPPLPVQEEIARILDTFTELTAELTAELTDRKKQYEYYRDKLLENSRKIITIKLGDAGTFYGGLTGKNKNDFENGNAKLITYKNVYNNISLDINSSETVKISANEKQNTLKYGDIVFTGSSETIDECGFSSVVTQNPTDNLYLNSFCFFYRFNDLNIINPEYAKYLFRSTSLRKKIIKTAQGVTRFNVSKKRMENISISLPSIEIQNKIANTLDNFNSICSDLNIGLPAEIAARQKQYEYYRGKLLTFKEKKA